MTRGNIVLRHFMFNQLADLPETLIAGRERAYLEFMLNRWSFRRDCVAVDVYVDTDAAPGGLRGGFSYYRAIPETVQRANRKLTMPVLAIGAEHATADAPLVTMRDNATNLQGAVVPDCGHFIMEEAPDAFIGQPRGGGLPGRPRAGRSDDRASVAAVPAAGCGNEHGVLSDLRAGLLPDGRDHAA